MESEGLGIARIYASEEILAPAKHRLQERE